QVKNIHPLLSLTHDMSGPCDTRSVRCWKRSRQGGEDELGGALCGYGRAIRGGLRGEPHENTGICRALPTFPQGRQQRTTYVLLKIGQLHVLPTVMDRPLCRPLSVRPNMSAAEERVQ